MSNGRPTDLEERRVMRLLAGAADEVVPLAPGAVERALRDATRGPSRVHRPRLRLHHLVAAAAAVAVALGSTLGLVAPQPQRPPAGTVSAEVGLASFPEGSALRLLLAPRTEARSS